MAGKALAKSSGHGGPRKGAGRKPGALNVKTQQIAEQAMEEGITPLEVMLKNMRYYEQCADGVTAKLEEAAALMTPQVIAAGGEAVMDVLKLIQKMGDFRMKAQECAVDAAPYVHPKLASIEFKPKHNTLAEIIGALSSPKDAAATYGALLDITPVEDGDTVSA